MPDEKIKRKRKWFIIPLVLLAAIAAAGIYGYGYYNESIYSPISQSEEPKKVEISIKRGTGSSQIAQQLYDAGLIRNIDTFKLYLRFSELGDKIQAGNYELSTSMNVVDIVDKMVRGDVIRDTITVTIPEGYSIADMADAFEKAGLVSKDKFLEAVKGDSYNYDFLSGIKERPERLEGYLFPDTYEFAKNVTAEQIVDRMLKRFDEMFTQDMRDKAKEMDMSIDDVVIMASIIEKEARLADERPIIAAVYYNRLKKNMLLQADATVQYALGKWREKLYYKDLEVDSQYNTYKYPGLPIGPIASPGKASLLAALNPEDVDYLFYVAKPDGSGAHSFTVTYEDFQKEKAKNTTN